METKICLEIGCTEAVSKRVINLAGSRDPISFFKPFINAAVSIFSQFNSSCAILSDQTLIEFLSVLGVEPTEVVALVLMYKGAVEIVGQIKCCELACILAESNCHHMESLKRTIEDWRLLSCNVDFITPVYKYTFDVSLDEGKKNIEASLCADYWRLFLSPISPIGERIATFLDSQTRRGVSRDVWNLAIQFCSSINPNLSNYSDNDAWPVFFDDYVDWELSLK